MEAHLVEHVLGGAAQQDGAGLGLLAVHDEREELVAQLEHLKQARARADVAVPDLFHPARPHSRVANNPTLGST